MATANPGSGWQDPLDALAAAPEHHTLLLENDQVRVLDARIPAGATTRVHTHRWPAVLYIVSWSPFVRRDGDGNLMLDSRTVPALATPPSTLWSGPLPAHSLENVGDTELRVISMELKSPSMSGPGAATGGA